MAGRPQIKSKVVKATLANKDVLDMFQGVLGTSEGAGALPVIHPKYLRIRTHIDRFIRLLTALRDSALMGRFPGPKAHLEEYVAALGGQFVASFNAPDLGEGVDYGRVSPELARQFGEAFQAAKKCNLVHMAIVTCKNLVPHKKSLEDPKALKDRFLVKDAGMTFAPLPDLPQLNFRQIYIGDLSPSEKEFVMMVLHKLLTITHDVYEAVSSPDIDVNEFVDVIVSSIGEVKKHIPRCNEAFKKIEESVDLLKGNFGGYYKDYTASGNPTIIMENFVLDVSRNTKTSPQVTAQFRRIIAHYRKLASQQASHPKLQSLFQQVDANFQELERKSRDADAGGDDSDTDSSNESASPDEAAPTAAGPAATTGPAAAAAATTDAPTAAGPSAKSRRKKRAKGRARARAAAAAGAKPSGEGLADEFDKEPLPEEDDEALPEGGEPDGGEAQA
jgi:hypothetical protein